MDSRNHWLLPKGVEEILPSEAWLIDQYQRQILDIYHSWGYELVIPPLIEYQESLSAGLGADLDLLSFKLTDQMSGRTLAVRADITPQAARIDAHSWAQEGPTRLCYSGTVLHTRPKTELSSRTPLQIGAELYGSNAIESDLEVILLMLKSIEAAQIQQITLDLGQVALYRELVELIDFDEHQQAALFDAFSRKAEAEIAVLLAACDNQLIAETLLGLLALHGDEQVVYQAKTRFAEGPQNIVNAIDELIQVVEAVRLRYPEVNIHIDLAEVRGYQYHTGLIFATYIDSVPQPVASGGRYDGIGELYGRKRPATGFTIDVNSIVHFLKQGDTQLLVLAPSIMVEDEALTALIKDLRQQGFRVVHAVEGSQKLAHCARFIENNDGHWQVIDRKNP